MAFAVSLCVLVSTLKADEPAAQPALDAAAQAEFFEARIRPLLAGRCFECHGPEKQESGLRLDSRAGVLKGGDSGPAAIDGQPDKSRLVEAIGYQGDLAMPPDEQLGQQEIADLTAWIAMGLPWSGDGGAAVETMDQRVERFRLEHWSLQPVAMPQSPVVRDGSWAADPLDGFVLANLEAVGLAPSPAADRRTWIRRVTFDLTGVPPLYEDILAFEQDASPDAFAKVVDRLLASPLYGQRWARHWLDVARYADTKGYVFTQDPRYAYAYTYRDYVVKSLNDDLPYDQFVMEQLAADLLPETPDHRSLTAMGFLTLGRRFMFNPHDIIDDRIDVTTRGLMGLTVTCARCHDHKYDPIPQADYYSLYGVFASTQEPDELPLVGMPAETEAYRAFEKDLAARQGALDAFLDEQIPRLLDELRSRVGDYLVEATKPRVTKDGDDAMLSFSPGDVRPEMVERWRRFIRRRAGPTHPVFGLWHAYLELPKDTFAASAAELSAKLAAIAAGQGDVAGMGETFGAANPRVRQALIDRPPTSREDLAARYGELLSGAYQAWKGTQAIEPADQRLKALPDAAQEELRQILFAEKAPLDIPRDEAHEFFDRETNNKYGQLNRAVGELRSHSPEAPPRAMVLLESGAPHAPRIFQRGNPGRPGDEVPRRFLVALSSAERPVYENKSGRLEVARAIADPNNPLTARVAVNRVWMHHFGAGLVRTPGDFGARGELPTHPGLLDHLAATFVAEGWSLKKLHRRIVLSSTYRQQSLPRAECAAVDPENRLLWRANPRRLEFEALRDAVLAVAGELDTALDGRSVDLFAEPFSKRRTIYGFIDRQDLPGLFRIFDFANPDVSTPQRPETTVPQQALFVMNSPFVVAESRKLAERAAMAGDDVAARVVALHRWLYGRDPAPDEIELARQFVEGAAPAAGDVKLQPWEQYAQALICANEFLFVD